MSGRNSTARHLRDAGTCADSRALRHNSSGLTTGTRVAPRRIVPTPSWNNTNLKQRSRSQSSLGWSTTRSASFDEGSPFLAVV